MAIFDKILQLFPAKILVAFTSVTVSAVIGLSSYFVVNQLKQINARFAQIEAVNQEQFIKTRKYITDQFTVLRADQRLTNKIFIEEFKRLSTSPDYSQKLDQMLSLLNQISCDNEQKVNLLDPPLRLLNARIGVRKIN